MDLTTWLWLTIFVQLNSEFIVNSVQGRRRDRTVYKPQAEILNGGVIRGKFGKSRNKRVVYQFLGIPYAEPPINERRFEPPLPVTSKWSGIRYVEKYRPACLQLNLITVRLTGTEDCLYANIFVPKTDGTPTIPNIGSELDGDDQNEEDDDDEDEEDERRSLTPRRQRSRSSRGRRHSERRRDRQERRRHGRRRDEKDEEIGVNVLDNFGPGKPLLPVMIYIYGGYFMYGSARLYGPQYFMDEDVVFVTFNYRVGALGFLNTGATNPLIRGNMGLKDQNLLLHWVKENIRQFGGDPNKITLMGESAGASSVHLHILSRMSAGLFQKSIAQSGTAIRTWTIVENPGEQATRLAGQLNCSTINSNELVKCLKSVDPFKIVSTHYERLDILSNPLAQYGPTLEGILDENTFLHRHPMEILESGNFNHIPLLIGVTKDEGLIYSARIIKNQNVTHRIEHDWSKTAPILLNYNGSVKPEGAEKIRNFYLGHYPPPGSKNVDFASNFKQFTQMFTDRFYVAATRKTALVHAKYAPVYAYFYSHEGEFSFYNVFLTAADAIVGEGRNPAGGTVRVQQLTYSLLSGWVNRNIFGENQPRAGVCHLDDVVMLFKLRPLSNIRRREADYPMSRAMVKSWVQFARDHQNLSFNNQIWPPINFNEESPLYMNLNAQNGGLITEPFTARAKFWEDFEKTVL